MSSAVFSSEQWTTLSTELGLSSRELDILRGVFDGKTERDIALLLQVSPHTVHTYVERLYKKLGVDRRDMLILAVMSHFMKRAELGANGVLPGE